MDSAIDALVNSGYADPARIGMISFSHSGYHVYYTITHPGKRKLAAVACLDSMTASYRNYVSMTAGSISASRAYETYMGGKSFWENKNEWIEMETTFNVDRVETPALFTASGSWRTVDEVGYPETMLETIGVFLRNKKPMEYLSRRQ